ncbi:MAG: hypothetical protein HKN11_09245 [Rhizobiales bacterium]|nr:hypothetical protein [Hyphomicrobiales bacterium]
MKHAMRQCTLVVCLSVCIVSLSIRPAASQTTDIEWGEYMTSAFLVGAIAAAMSKVEHCSKKPILMQEYRQGNDKRHLVFTCNGTEDEQASVILHLQKFGDTDWLPITFGLAG